MDPAKVKHLITPKTKAIMPVHIYGHPVDMDEIMKIADKHKLYVIEDATESLGSTYKGKATGTIGHIGCFSFNGNKLITTGAGGMLVANDENIGKRAKYLSNQTKTITDNKGMYHEEIGYNFRLPNLLAAMGCAQLENIDEYIKIKRANASHYNELLQSVKGITLPVEKEGIENVNWLYSIVVEDDFPISRDELIHRLYDKGIDSRPFFMAVHKMKPYENFKKGSMDTTNELEAKGLNLPSSVSLKREEIEYICGCLRELEIGSI